MLEFSPDDFDRVSAISRAEGYGDSWAYTSSSEVIGAFLLPTRPSQSQRVIIKTTECGFAVVRFLED